MRLAFQSPALPGHVNPMAALARTLERRGHDVFFLTLGDMSSVFETAGLKTRVYQSSIFAPGEFASRFKSLSFLSGNEAAAAASQLTQDSVAAAKDAGPQALRDSQADALILDSVAPGFAEVAGSIDLPFFRISIALHFDTSGHAPLCVYDSPYEVGPVAYRRNLEGVRAYIRRVASLTAGSSCFGTQSLKELRQPIAHLTQTPKDFDFPSDHLPATFHHCGPFQDYPHKQNFPFPWERLTGEPLIYASIGTIQNGLSEVVQMIAEAAAEPGRQVVFAGARIPPEQLQRLPANTIVCDRAPQRDILARASLCITHAGVNTVFDCLTEGVPMVAVPITFDQPGTAARIAHSGTGVFLPFSQVTVCKLRSMISRVLNEPRFRTNARGFAQSIATSRGTEVAANIIEGGLFQRQNGAR